MSGIATATAAMVKAVEGTRAKILETRYAAIRLVNSALLLDYNQD